MEIEICTTKKKLTKSIISQMRYADFRVLKFGISLGYIIKYQKDSYKILLIKFNDEYYIVHATWIKETPPSTSIFRKIGRFSSVKKFETIKDLDKWWHCYSLMVENTNNQIYI